jgi:Ca2+/Na+ antiporter
MILLIIIGVILLIMSFTLKQDQNPFSKFSSLARIIILLIALGVFFFCILNKMLEQWVLNPYTEMLSRMC